MGIPSRRGSRDRRSLADDREQDDDEDDVEDRRRFLDALENGEGGEQDRDGALEPAPRDEGTLPAAEAEGRERGQDDRRAHENGEGEHERDPVHPDLERERVDPDDQAEDDEDGDLGEDGERAVEALDLGLVRSARVTDDEPRDEHGEEPGAVCKRRHAVERPGKGERENWD